MENARLCSAYIFCLSALLGIASCYNDYCISNEGNCDNDQDVDNINDNTEFELAYTFAPQLVFSSTEVYGAYYPHWAVHTYSAVHVSIFYALSYYIDGGDMESGWPGHLGDPEFIVVDIEQNSGVWSATEIFLSAHYNAGEIWDYSGWYDSSSFSWNTSGGNNHPIIWVSNWKHANYTDRDSCDSGAAWFDWCNEGWREIFEVRNDSNLGSREYPFIDQAQHNGGNVEYYWSNPGLPFCGWQVNSRSVSDRNNYGCSDAENSYANVLAMWDAGIL